MYNRGSHMPRGNGAAILYQGRDPRSGGELPKMGMMIARRIPARESGGAETPHG